MYIFRQNSFRHRPVLEYSELMDFMVHVNGLQEFLFKKVRPLITMCQLSQKRSLNEVHKATSNDDYRLAISMLNSLQSSKQVKGPEMVEHPAHRISRMHSYLSKCGINLQNLEQKLSVIHVSGTKGKGSTCAYCECILRQYGYKTGFFSSPHLCSVRERIRINGKCLSERKFAEYFRSVYGQLKQFEETEPHPYFMFLTMMAFRVFLEESVDVGIIEVGIGGEYDCTNVLNNTSVVGISSLGFDHVRILGSSITEIAWQKAGIIKPSSIVVTAPEQPKTALKVLESRASEKGRTLYVAPNFSEYDFSEDIVLGIRGRIQKLNASLALQLTNAWMNSENYPRRKSGEIHTAAAFPLSKKMKNGLRTCSWPGRTQVLQYSPKLFYYLDGAHTDESIRFCLQWYEEETSSLTFVRRVLVFNTTGNRDSKSLLKLFLPYGFNLVCFCPNKSEISMDRSRDNWSSHGDGEEKRAKLNHSHWLELNSNADQDNTMLFSSVEEVHELMQTLVHNEDVRVLVTGSLHLVGAFLAQLGWNDEKL